MSEANVLVVDDEEPVRETTGEVLRRGGFDVDTAADGLQAIEMASRKSYDAAVVDLILPGLPGMEIVRRLKEQTPDTEIIIFTGNPSLDTSIQALQEHVFDYLCKPVDRQTMVRTVNRAVERRRLILQNRELTRQLEEERNGLRKQFHAAQKVLERRLEDISDFIGEGHAIRQIRRFIAEVAPSDMTILIRGESGTGKGVVARLIHESSGRDPNAFVKINCPAIPETLLESELFGHEPGAFTGADRRKPGRFELAPNGTAFLDEIGEIPAATQVKLLEVLENKQFTRLGGQETIHVNLRIIAATNAPIEAMIAEGRFRTDLFYRLNEYSIYLPPLRQRTEDIPLLVRHFLAKYAQRDSAGVSVTPETMALLADYDWPGNIRELEAAVRRFALTGDETAFLSMLGQSPEPAAASRPLPSKNELLRNREIETIMETLARAKWNRRRAAEMLGISYSALRRRIAKYDLKNRPTST